MKDKLPLLKRILDYISPPSSFSNAVYISAAQRLRNEADRLEQQEKDFWEFNELINEIERSNQPSA